MAGKKVQKKKLKAQDWDCICFLKYALAALPDLRYRMRPMTICRAWTRSSGYFILNSGERQTKRRWSGGRMGLLTRDRYDSEK